MTEPTPTPPPGNGTPIIPGRKLGIGVQEGQILLAVDDTPLAAFAPEQALTFAAHLLAATAKVMAQRHVVEEAVEAAAADIATQQMPTAAEIAAKLTAPATPPTTPA